MQEAQEVLEVQEEEEGRLLETPVVAVPPEVALQEVQVEEEEESLVGKLE